MPMPPTTVNNRNLCIVTPPIIMFDPPDRRPNMQKQPHYHANSRRGQEHDRHLPRIQLRGTRAQPPVFLLPVELGQQLADLCAPVAV